MEKGFPTLVVLWQVARPDSCIGGLWVASYRLPPYYTTPEAPSRTYFPVAAQQQSLGGSLGGSGIVLPRQERLPVLPSPIGSP